MPASPQRRRWATGWRSRRTPGADGCTSGGCWPAPTRRARRSRCASSLPVDHLRHTTASLLLAEGVHPKVVQEQLGHSTAALTLDTYSHVAPSLQAEAAARLERLLGANC
jgi:integrase